jgi:hypothetical protein
MPGGEVRSEEKGSNGNSDGYRSTRDVDRLLEQTGDEPQERDGKRNAPEASGYRPDSCVTDEERAARKRKVSDQKRNERPAVGFDAGHWIASLRSRTLGLASRRRHCEERSNEAIQDLHAQLI